MKSQDKHKT